MAFWNLSRSLEGSHRNKKETGASADVHGQTEPKKKGTPVSEVSINWPDVHCQRRVSNHKAGVLGSTVGQKDLAHSLIPAFNCRIADTISFVKEVA